jgi:hypothetical protein
LSHIYFQEIWLLEARLNWIVLDEFIGENEVYLVSHLPNC